MRILFCVIVALVLLGAWPDGAAAGSASTDCVEPREAQLLDYINDYREANGLNRLGSSDTLSAAGEHMVQDMSHYNYFGHHTADGTSFGDNQRNHGYTWNTYRGQNIAAGQGTAYGAFLAFKNSPPHNELMLDPGFVRIGVGYTYYPGSDYGYYWSVEFGGYPDANANWC